MYKYLFSFMAAFVLVASNADARIFQYAHETDTSIVRYGYNGDLLDVGAEGSNEFFENPFVENEVNFDFDRSGLKRREMGTHTLRTISLRGAHYNEVALDRQADYLKKYPETDVFIVGHTDIRGSHSYNDRLGMRRAKAVKKGLVKRGIDVNRIHTVSAGEREVAFSNHDMNRRGASVVQD